MYSIDTRLGSRKAIRPLFDLFTDLTLVATTLTVSAIAFHFFNVINLQQTAIIAGLFTIILITPELFSLMCGGCKKEKNVLKEPESAPSSLVNQIIAKDPANKSPDVLTPNREEETQDNEDNNRVETNRDFLTYNYFYDPLPLNLLTELEKSKEVETFIKYAKTQQIYRDFEGGLLNVYEEDFLKLLSPFVIDCIEKTLKNISSLKISDEKKNELHTAFFNQILDIYVYFRIKKIYEKGSKVKINLGSEYSVTLPEDIFKSTPRNLKATEVILTPPELQALIFVLSGQLCDTSSFGQEMLAKREFRCNQTSWNWQYISY